MDDAVLSTLGEQVGGFVVSYIAIAEFVGEDGCRKVTYQIPTDQSDVTTLGLIDYARESVKQAIWTMED